MRVKQRRPVSAGFGLATVGIRRPLSLVWDRLSPSARRRAQAARMGNLVRWSAGTAHPPDFRVPPRRPPGELRDHRPHSAVPGWRPVTAARTWVIDAANVMGSRPDGWWRDRAGAAARLHARILRLLASPVVLTDGRWPPAAESATAAAASSGAQGVPDERGLADSANPAAPAGTTDPAGVTIAPQRAVLVLEGAARAGVQPGTVGPGNESTLAEGISQPPGSPRSLTVVHAPGSGDDAIVAAARAASGPVLVFTSDRELRTRLTAAGAHVRGSGSLWALLDRV